jgi:hypothetical protein
MATLLHILDFLAIPAILAVSSHTPATYLMAMCNAEMHPFFGGTLQSTRGRGSWDPNGRPQSTGLQAFPGLPADAALGLAM